MKERVSFTFDKETIDLINDHFQKDGYRNRSHFVESAILAFYKNEEDTGGAHYES